MTNNRFNVLSLSDMLVSFIYSPQVCRRFGDVDLVIGCGDLAYYYLEYVLNALDVPCFFVRGNHDKEVEYSLEGQRSAPDGAVNLHGKVISHRGLLLAGVEGSLRYRPGKFQYAPSEMWRHVFRLVPGLVGNKIRFGRYLDIFVTHSPPEGIHDMPDLPHQGIKAFRWMLKVFKPAYHFHGHVHIYRPETVSRSIFEGTLVINSYGYRETVLELNNKNR